MTQTISAPRKKVKSRKLSSSPNYAALESLRRNNNLVGTTVTFNFLDGTSKSQPLQKQFVETDKGRIRSTQEILEDLNAIAADYDADNFVI